MCDTARFGIRKKINKKLCSNLMGLNIVINIFKCNISFGLIRQPLKDRGGGKKNIVRIITESGKVGKAEANYKVHWDFSMTLLSLCHTSTSQEKSVPSRRVT